MTREDLQQISELMDTKISPIVERLDKVDSRLDKVDSRLDAMDARFDKVDGRMDKMDAHFTEVDGLLDKLETNTRQTRVLVERQQHDISLIAEQYGDVAAKLERIGEVDELKGRVRARWSASCATTPRPFRS